MFEVRWREEALEELAAVWTRADSAGRVRINAAADRIDHQLQGDPLAQSESRDARLRILFAPPLGVTFQIEPDGQTVSVLSVWSFRRRSHP